VECDAWLVTDEVLAQRFDFLYTELDYAKEHLYANDWLWLLGPNSRPTRESAEGRFWTGQKLQFENTGTITSWYSLM